MCGIFKYCLHYRHIRRLKDVHPLNMLDYKKEDAVKMLKEAFGLKLMQINIMNIYLQDFMKGIGYLKNLVMIKENIISLVLF